MTSLYKNLLNLFSVTAVAGGWYVLRWCAFLWQHQPLHKPSLWAESVPLSGVHLSPGPQISSHRVLRLQEHQCRRRTWVWFTSLSIYFLILNLGWLNMLVSPSCTSWMHLLVLIYFYRNIKLEFLSPSQVWLRWSLLGRKREAVQLPVWLIQMQALSHCHRPETGRQYSGRPAAQRPARYQLVHPIQPQLSPLTAIFLA